MRGQILDVIFERMRFDPNIFFLNADMGINLVEKFERAYPDRYANVGIAEQNLISICSGLANIGYRPFAYTISNFIVHRCFEQIRNDIALHDYPITLLGTSTGFDNSPLGPTHHVIDDWGVIKNIPGIEIYCPSSVSYAAKLVDHILLTGRPSYVRIPKNTNDSPESENHLVKLQGSRDDTILVSYGNPAQTCIQAQRIDKRISVLIVNRLNPLDEEDLILALEKHRRIIIVEDHFPNSGLYGTLCEFLSRHKLRGHLESISPNEYSFEVGLSPNYFYQKFRMDLPNILKIIEN